MLKGSFPALITPFTERETVDVASVTKLFSWHANQNSAGWVVLGSTAEALGLSNDERETILRVAQETLPKEKVIVGVAGPSTQAVIHHAKQAKDYGFSKVLLVTPYYARPSQEELISQVQTVVDAVDCEVIVYTVPPRTGVDYTDDTIIRLAHMERVIGLKDAGSDIMRAERIKKQVPDDFAYLSGDDQSTLLRLSAGGDGVISVCANVVPDLMQSLCAHANNQSWQEAKQSHELLQPYFQAMALGGNPAVIKYIAAKKWHFPYYLRAPLMPLPGTLCQKIASLLPG